MRRTALWIGTCSLLATSFIPPPDNGCTGLGTDVAVALICSGECDSGECESRGDGLDEIGAFSYCGCFARDYDNCCTVVLRDGRARPRGTCPPCGASGVCQLTDNSPEGNQNEPDCSPKETRHAGKGPR